MRWPLLTALLFLSCAKAKDERPPRGITVLLNQPPDTLDARMYVSGWGARVTELTQPGLLSVNDQSEYEPDLAESFTRLDDRTWQFVLRDNLYFHDGSRVTADDVKATFDGLSSVTGSPRKDNYEAVESIEVIDTRTVRFHLRHPYAPLLAELTLGIVPKSRAFGDDAAKLQDKSPIGAGPFRVVSWADEDHVELVPFEKYYRGKPQIEALHLRVVRDQTTRILELMKGRADLITDLGATVLPVLQERKELHVEAVPSLSYAYMNLNVRSGPLRDVRVRQAICHGIDIDELISAKFHGYAEKATSMLPDSHWAFRKTKGCDHDPALAKRLLAEAGYPKLTLTLKTSTDRFRKSVALVFKEQLAKVGIELDVRSYDMGTIMSDLKHGNFEATTMMYFAIDEADFFRQVFDTRFIPTEANGWNGHNRGGYSNGELDQLLEQAVSAPDDVRKQLYGRAQEILAEELPVISLWHEDYISASGPRLSGFKLDAHGSYLKLATAREVKAP